MTVCAALPTRVAISAGSYTAGATWSGISGSQALALDLDGITTVPSGSKTVIIAANTNSVGGRFGVQKTGSTDFVVSESAVTARQDFWFYIELNATNTIDLFVTSTTNVVFYVIGFMDHLHHITPVSVGGAITSASTFTIDLGTTDIVPAGAASGCVIVKVDKLCKLAGTSAALSTLLKPAANVQGAIVIVPLDAARKFYVQSYASFGGASALQVLAWAPPNCFIPPASYSSEDVSVADSTFRKLARVINGVIAHYRINSGTTTAGGSGTPLRGLRPSGNTSYTIAIDADTALNNPYAHTVVNSSGEVDGFAAVANIHYEYHGAWAADTAFANISSISTLVAGATSTVVLNKSVSSFNNLAIKGSDNHIINVTSLSGSGTTWTFTVPNLVDGTDGIRLGSTIITPTTNDSQVGAEFTTAVYSKAGYTPVNIEDVLSGNVCEGDTPALLSGNQIAYDSSTGGSVDVHGIYSDPPPVYFGTQTMWHYAADFKWYSFIVETIDEVVDTTPDAASFGAVTGAALSTVSQLPATVTIAEVTATTNITATPGTGTDYRVSTDGGTVYGSWLSAPSNVQLNYKIQARITSSASYSTAVTASVTVGGTVFSGTVTTLAEPVIARRTLKANLVRTLKGSSKGLC